MNLFICVVLLAAANVVTSHSQAQSQPLTGHFRWSAKKVGNRRIAVLSLKPGIDPERDRRSVIGRDTSPARHLSHHHRHHHEQLYAEPSTLLEYAGPSPALDYVASSVALDAEDPASLPLTVTATEIVKDPSDRELKLRKDRRNKRRKGRRKKMRKKDGRPAKKRKNKEVAVEKINGVNETTMEELTKAERRRRRRRKKNKKRKKKLKRRRIKEKRRKKKNRGKPVPPPAQDGDIHTYGDMPAFPSPFQERHFEFHRLVEAFQVLINIGEVKGSEACQFENLKNCSQRLFKINTAVLHTDARCSIRKEFLECMERIRDIEPCDPGATSHGNISELRQLIKEAVWTNSSCILNEALRG